MKSEQSLSKTTQTQNTSTLRWTASIIAVTVGIVNFYYGNQNTAGSIETLWYVMGGIYIFAAIVLAANVMPHFAQPTVFGYALFLISLWAVAAALTGAGLDMIAYLDKVIEAVLVINMTLLIKNSRATTSWR